jgi:hypothetical protein
MIGDHLRGGARHVAEVVQAPLGRAEVVPRVRHPHDVRGATGERPRREQPPQGGALVFQRALPGAASRGELRDGLARFARVGLDGEQSAVRVGDRSLGVAQRVARLAPVGLAAFQLAAQRLDPRAQRGKVFFACRRCRRGQKGESRKEQEPLQDLAFPCAATAARRFSTSAASPR